MPSPRCVIWMLVIYIALDLSVAAMPGAFVFDPGESVENIQMSRMREAAGAAMAAAPTPPPTAAAATRGAVVRKIVPVPRSPQHAPLRTRYGLPTSLDEPAPPSEDSH